MDTTDKSLKEILVVGLFPGKNNKVSNRLITYLNSSKDKVANVAVTKQLHTHTHT